MRGGSSGVGVRRIKGLPGPKGMSGGGGASVPEGRPRAGNRRALRARRLRRPRLRPSGTTGPARCTPPARPPEGRAGGQEAKRMDYQRAQGSERVRREGPGGAANGEARLVAHMRDGRVRRIRRWCGWTDRRLDGSMARWLDGWLGLVGRSSGGLTRCARKRMRTGLVADGCCTRTSQRVRIPPGPEAGVRPGCPERSGFDSAHMTAVTAVYATSRACSFAALPGLSRRTRAVSCALWELSLSPPARPLAF